VETATVVTGNTPETWDRMAVHAGTSWDAAMWGNERSQTVRFLAALHHLDLRGGDTLLDVGCGTGRFSEFLPESVAYTGTDWSKKMLVRAEFEHPGRTFRGEIPWWRYDHVVAIGTFNLEGNTTTQLQLWLESFWKLRTKRSLLLSVLRVGAERCVAFAPSWLAQMGEELSPRSFLVDCSYLPNDAMLVLKR